MKDFSYITNSHPAFIENLYQDFVKDPTSVDPELKKFFEGFDFAVITRTGRYKWFPDPSCRERQWSSGPPKPRRQATAEVKTPGIDWKKEWAPTA